MKEDVTFVTKSLVLISYMPCNVQDIALRLMRRETKYDEMMENPGDC